MEDDSIKIVHVCLCGSYNDNWGYQDNIIPKFNKKAGHDVTVITSIFTDNIDSKGYDRVDPKEYYSSDGVKIIRIPFKRGISRVVNEKLRRYDNLYHNLVKEKPDLIFMHGIQFLDMKTIIKYKDSNPTCVIHADNHASYENSGKNFISRNILHRLIFKRTIHKSLKHISKIFSITPGCEKFAIDMYNIPEKKRDFLYLGVDTDKLNFSKRTEICRTVRDKNGITESDFVIITGGKINKDKKIDVLLSAISKIENSNIKLIIFGNISTDIEEELINYINKDSRVIYTGWKNQDEIYNLYFASDIAVFPGTQSALWQQAIGSGLPLLVENLEGIDYLDVGGNCIFLDKNIEKSIIEKIKLLTNNECKLAEMKKIANTIGYETFSYENISQKAVKI